MKIKIWTRGYNPFSLGGVHAPVSCYTNGTPTQLARGFRGYIVKSPKGKTFIVEAESGGIVGDDLEEVRKDIKRGDLKEMREQVKKAKAQLKSAVLVGEEKFWEMMR